MARSSRVSLALAVLVVGAAALQLAPGAEDICGRGLVDYEHLDERYPHACLVYCVPTGACAEKEAVGALDELELAGRGDCQGRGFTEPAALGNVTSPIAERLRHFRGPCRGMRVLKFRRPQPEEGGPAAGPKRLPPEEEEEEGPAAPGRAGGLCAKAETPFRAISERDGETQCTVYCVPAGACLDSARRGKLGYLNVSGEGLCQGGGYTLHVEPSDVAKYWISHLRGQCAGMTMHQFRRPAPGRACGPYLKPFRAVEQTFGGQTVCTAYCLPDGRCYGLAQTGHLKSLGITSDGGCAAQDFPEPVPLTSFKQFTAINAGGEYCRGMTMHRFQQQPAAAQPAAPGGGVGK